MTKEEKERKEMLAEFDRLTRWRNRYILARKEIPGTQGAFQLLYIPKKQIVKFEVDESQKPDMDIHSLVTMKNGVVHKCQISWWDMIHHAKELPSAAEALPAYQKAINKWKKLHNIKD